MRHVFRTVVATAAAALLVGTTAAHGQSEMARAVEGGGISVPGWTGRIDAKEASEGQVLTNSRLAPAEDGMRVTTGPAGAYWNPDNVARGNYTVRGTFTEPEYMSLNDHPHPYGIFIGGNEMGTDQQSYLYCAAYGNGNFIVRGFGPEPFQVNGRRGEAHDAVNRAAGQGQPVEQDIAVSVKDDRVECSINGTVVGSYPKSDVLGEGRLKSTDGVYGIRFAHNTDATVTGFSVTQD